MPPFAAVAALLADPARAAMLGALLGGEALTAGELARAAGVAAPTASGHLARLVEGGLATVHAQGRHRYHRLASEEVATALETLGALAGSVAPARRWAHGEAFRTARLCYDHLAGRLGVALHGALVARGWLRAAPGGWAATRDGEAGLEALGVDLAAAHTARRFACDCMDWSERRPHLAGGLGREVAAACLRHRLLTRATAPPAGPDPLARRRLHLTPEGARRLTRRSASGWRRECCSLGGRCPPNPPPRVQTLGTRFPRWGGGCGPLGPQPPPHRGT